MPQPFKPKTIDSQDFPTPDGAVRPISRSIHGQAENGTGKVLFGHNRGNVRVMVLHRQAGRVFLSERPLSAEIIGMKIVGEALGLDLEDLP